MHKPTCAAMLAAFHNAVNAVREAYATGNDTLAIRIGTLNLHDLSDEVDGHMTGECTCNVSEPDV